MHVLILIAAKYPLPGYGGTERAAYWLGKSLAEKGHKVSFCCHGDSEIPFADVIPMPNDLMDFDDVTVYAKYSNFYIGDESSKYRLTVGGYNGTAGIL